MDKRIGVKQHNSLEKRQNSEAYHKKVFFFLMEALILLKIIYKYVVQRAIQSENETYSIMIEAGISLCLYTGYFPIRSSQICLNCV